MSRAKTAQNRVGQMAFVDMSPISPVIPFPSSAVRKRVIIERPAPDPVRRTCPVCGAIFDDYTQRWNTIYDRTSCRVKASELKRDEAIKLLAEVMSIPVDLADDMYIQRGLKHVESLLNDAGYRWDVWSKAWVKA